MTQDPYAADDPRSTAADNGLSPAGDPRQERSERIERVESVEGERSISPVSNRFGGKPGQAIGMVALLATGGLLAMASLANSKDDDAAARRERDRERASPVAQVVQFEPGARQGPPPELPPPPNLVTGQAGGATLTGAAAAPSGSQGGAPAGRDPRIALAESARRAPVLAYSANTRGGPAGVAEAMYQPAGPAGAGRPAGGGTELDSLRRHSTIDEVQARRLPDRNLLITAGTVIPCVLQTAMETSNPGYVTCVIPRDVYSDNGNVVLMEKGTKVLGEYNTGLRRGQRRLFVVWNRAVTPTGIAIDVGSPASDALGRAGFDGQIDSRFWDRFGGALLLSLVDDAVAVAANGNNYANNTVRLPSDAAGIALENSINIPPVLRKRQGEEVAIMVSRDFNFASVYALRAQ